MSQDSAARRYAEALLETVWSQGAPGAAGTSAQELERLCEAMKASDDLENALHNPSYGADERVKVVEAVASSLSMSPTVKNFLKLVVERGRAAELPAIASSFRKMLDAREGRVVAKVLSATQLSSKAMSALKTALESKTGKKVQLETEVDPELLGGVRAEVGSLVYDGTLRAELERLRETLGGPAT